MTPVVGDIVTFCHWDSGGTPAAAWTGTMAWYVAEADDATGLLPDGTAAYLFGGA